VTGPWRLLEGPAGVLCHYTTTAFSPEGADRPVLLLCHELPRAKGGAAEAGRMYPTLADRLSKECGVAVTTGTLRGAGGSEGDFSASGWLEDLEFLVGHEVGTAGRIVLVGFGLGGTLALRLAALDSRVCGVAVVAPADFTTFLGDPEPLVARCRLTGVITRSGFPADPAEWVAELVDLRPLEAAAELRSRPLLVVHGSDDSDVSVASATALAGATTGPVDLRIVPGGGHWLRADPRVVATLIGWTERQR